MLLSTLSWKDTVMPRLALSHWKDDIDIRVVVAESPGIEMDDTPGHAPIKQSCENSSTCRDLRLTASFEHDHDYVNCDQLFDRPAWAAIMFRRPRQTKTDPVVTRLGDILHPARMYPWHNMAMHYLGCPIYLGGSSRGHFVPAFRGKRLLTNQ
jgi:hypothetical protein